MRQLPVRADSNDTRARSQKPCVSGRNQRSVQPLVSLWLLPQDEESLGKAPDTDLSLYCTHLEVMADCPFKAVLEEYVGTGDAVARAAIQTAIACSADHFELSTDMYKLAITEQDMFGSNDERRLSCVQRAVRVSSTLL